MADALDGDSAYLDAEELRLYQSPAREGEADVGLALTRRFAFVMVVAARPGSPAEKAGLRPGDLVKSIDERHTRPMPAVVAERLLRGAPGSSVKLGILRAGADPFEVTAVRERVLPSAPQGRMLEAGTGYVKVADFMPATAEDVRTQVEALRRDGATRLLLDLRGAAWGSPADGVRVAELFLQGGPVAKLVGRRAEEQLLSADPARSAWSGPLAVLVDNGTPGPGEIVAAALLDAGGARLVGERTVRAGGTLEAGAAPRGRAGAELLIGKSAEPELRRRIDELIAADPAIQELLNTITLQMGPQILLAAKVRMCSGLTIDEAVCRINELERQIKAACPEVGWCFVEPDVTD